MQSRPSFSHDSQNYQGECEINWFKRLFSAEHKAEKAIPDKREKPKAEYSTPATLLAEAAAARQLAVQRAAAERKRREALEIQTPPTRSFVASGRESTPNNSRRKFLIAGGLVTATGVLGYLGWRALDGPGNKAWPTPISTWAPMAPPIQGAPLVLTLAQSVTMTLVRVPAGEFIMGSSDADWGAESDEKPQHTVYLDEYLIGKYEVTVAQFRAFIDDTGYQANQHAVLTGKDDLPVAMVNWDDAVAFCRWVSEVTGQNMRLPTEAEWEKAARGTDGRIYPWGNEPPNNSRCNYDNKIGTMPVGSYSPAGDSPYGCADMAGNVWEWVNDWYQADYYATSPGRNPPGPAKGDSRVLRGGGWYGYCYHNRAADRAYSFFPDNSSYDFGFRCAASPGN